MPTCMSCTYYAACPQDSDIVDCEAANNSLVSPVPPTVYRIFYVANGGIMWSEAEYTDYRAAQANAEYLPAEAKARVISFCTLHGAVISSDGCYMCKDEYDSMSMSNQEEDLGYSLG